jgi:hypothetical protein
VSVEVIRESALIGLFNSGAIEGRILSYRRF